MSSRSDSIFLLPSVPPRPPYTISSPDPATIAYQRPLKQPYVMRSLDWPTDVSLSQVPVSQPFWWEVLCLANTDPELVETVVSIIRLPHIKVCATFSVCVCVSSAW